MALGAADWAVHLPPTVSGNLPCVPLDQAREAIAIWLAILATRPSAAELRSGLGSGGRWTGAEVRNTTVLFWNYPGSNAGYVTPGELQTTAAGYALANAMTSLPEQKVSHVLAGAWATWVNWHTTDAQLAAALGIPVPSIPGPPLPRPGTTTTPGPGTGPQSPVCTT